MIRFRKPDILPAVVLVACFSVHLAATSGPLTNINVTVNVRERNTSDTRALPGLLTILGLEEQTTGSRVRMRSLLTVVDPEGITTAIVNRVIESGTTITATPAGSRGGCGSFLVDPAPDGIGNGRRVNVQPITLALGSSRRNVLASSFCSLARQLQNPSESLVTPLAKLNGLIRADILNVLQVTGDTSDPVSGTTGTLRGTVSVSEISIDPAGGLAVSGTLTARVTEQSGTRLLVAAQLHSHLNLSGTPSAASCSAFEVQFTSIHVEGSGLNIVLDPITVDVPGGISRANPISNVLCAITRQLNTTAGSSLRSKLQRLNGLLNLI